MKEKEIRNKIETYITSTAGLGPRKEPVWYTLYACSFPEPVQNTYVYAAPMPGTWGPPPTDFIPYIPVPVDQISEPVKHPAPKVDKSELDELILGVLALKGQTVEIFELKALAAAIKERVEKVIL